MQRARAMAAEFEYKNGSAAVAFSTVLTLSAGYRIPIAVLAQKMADMAQVYTQHAFMRALAVGTNEGLARGVRAPCSRAPRSVADRLD